MDSCEDYNKFAVIGRGAFGVVYLCRRMEDDNRVVLKNIPIMGMSKEEVKAVTNEVHILASLKNPHIIRYYTSFIEKEALIIVMEYAIRGNLQTFIQNQNGMLLSEKLVLDIFAQLCTALDYLHKKMILHRDLTASNVLLTGTSRYIVKLTDFGISKKLGTYSNASSLVGTPHYLAPELCRGMNYRTSCDLWSLGCILYLLLTLNLPFSGDNIGAITRRVMEEPVDMLAVDQTIYDRGLLEIAYRLLCKEPAERPSAEMVLQHPTILPVVYQLGVDLHYVNYLRPHEDRSDYERTEL